MAPKSPFINRIALIYQIWFLYFEPVAALGGTYLCLFTPDRFLAGTMPLPTHLAATSGTSSPITPLLRMMLVNTGALYALFAIMEGVVLRLTKEKSVRLAALAAKLACDVGHLYAVFKMRPRGYGRLQRGIATSGLITGR